MIPPVVLSAQRDPRLSHRARSVLLVLWSFAGPKKREVWPKRETIAELSGLAVTHVSNATTELQEAGYITKDGAGGYSRATRYTLLDEVNNGTASGTVNRPESDPETTEQRYRQRYGSRTNNGTAGGTGPRTAGGTGKEETTGRDLSTGSSTKAGTLPRTRARDGPRSARTPEETSNRQERRDDRPEQRATTSAQPGRGLPRATPRGSGGPRQDPRQRRRGESAVAYVTRIQELDARERAGDGATVDLAARDWRRE